MLVYSGGEVGGGAEYPEWREEIVRESGRGEGSGITVGSGFRDLHLACCITTS